MRKFWKIIATALIGFLVIIFGLIGDYESNSGNDVNGDVAYSLDLPIYDDVKGRGNIPDNVAQLAVGVGVKYQLLPSVIISQWAYESSWGKSVAASLDNNFFGITWFTGAPYTQGSSRGVGGSEGGYYMRFPSIEENFNYYGYMISSQSNFNASVGNKNPSDVLLILGRGGYAAAGITTSSPYYTSAMSIINSNNLTEYDNYAISKWGSYHNSSSSKGTGNVSVLESILGQQVNGGQCYGLTAYYVSQLNGPQMMGSGKMFASQIGSDYNWSAYGFEVIFNPTVSDLQAGDIFNCTSNYSIYGHTGIVASVSNGGAVYETYEQSAEKGQIVAKYTRTFGSDTIVSIVRKVK